MEASAQRAHTYTRKFYHEKSVALEVLLNECNQARQMNVEHLPMTQKPSVPGTITTRPSNGPPNNNRISFQNVLAIAPSANGEGSGIIQNPAARPAQQDRA